MHFAHNIIFNISFETQTKIHCAFHITKNWFQCNLMWLCRINHKMGHNPITYVILGLMHTIVYMKLLMTFWNKIARITSKPPSPWGPISFKSL
jgi:hypothetical protein